MGGPPYAVADFGSYYNEKVYWEGNDDLIWYAEQGGGNWVSGTNTSAVPASSSLAPVNPSSGLEHVVYVGADEGLWDIDDSNGTWSSPFEAPGTAPLGDGPGGSTPGNGTITALWAGGTDVGLWLDTYSSGSWIRSGPVEVETQM